MSLIIFSTLRDTFPGFCGTTPRDRISKATERHPKYQRVPKKPRFPKQQRVTNMNRGHWSHILGHLRIPRDTEGHRRTPKDPEGCRRIPKGAEGCRRMPRRSSNMQAASQVFNPLSLFPFHAKPGLTRPWHPRRAQDAPKRGPRAVSIFFSGSWGAKGGKKGGPRGA